VTCWLGDQETSKSIVILNEPLGEVKNLSDDATKHRVLLNELPSATLSF